MSTRLPPEMPRNKVLTTLAKGPLRTVVVCLSIAAIAWGLAFGIQSFRDIGFDRSASGSGDLVTFDIIIGALMCGFGAFMIFGLVAAILNRPTLARTFAYVSFVAALVLIAGQLFIVIAHFRFQSQIISECQTAVTNLTVVTGNPFWFGYTEHQLSASDAQSFCNSAFSRQSASVILWLIVAIVASVIFIPIALAWSYQVLDPSYGRSAPPRADAIRMGSFYPNGEPRYDSGPYAQRDPFADNRSDAFVPPYDANMPPKYANSEGHEAPMEKGASNDHEEHEPMYGSNREAWAQSDTDLAGPRIQERRTDEI